MTPNLTDALARLQAAYPGWTWYIREPEIERGRFGSVDESVRQSTRKPFIGGICGAVSVTVEPVVRAWRAVAETEGRTFRASEPYYDAPVVAVAEALHLARLVAKHEASVWAVRAAALEGK